MENKGVKGLSRGFVIVLNAWIWLVLCLGLFRHWRGMPGVVHACSISLAITFPTLCLFMLREKSGLPSLLTAAAAFAAAVGALFA